MGISYDRPPKTFLAATAGHVRNDLQTNGKWVRNAISRQASFLQNRMGQVLPGKNQAGRTIRNSAAALRLWVTHVSAPLNMSQLVVDVQLLPTDTAAGSPRWWIVLDGVAQGDQFHNVRCAAGSGTTFADIFEMQQVLVVDQDVGSTIEIWTDDNCRVVGWDLHFRGKESVDASVTDDTLIQYATELPLSPVQRVDSVGYIYPPSPAVTATKLWSRQRAYHLNWQVDDPASPRSVSATVASPLWGVATVGPTAPTQYRNSYANENLLGGIAAKSIRTYVWAYAEKTAGVGDVLVRFISDSMPGGFDLHVTGALARYSDDGDPLGFTLLPQAAGDCIRVQYLTSAGGVAGNIYAVGCYQLAEGS